jgi:hypothetical protein
MKQKKGRDYKSVQRFTDENRCGEKRLEENIKLAEIKGEFDEDKLIPQQVNNKKRR